MMPSKANIAIWRCTRCCATASDALTGDVPFGAVWGALSEDGSCAGGSAGCVDTGAGAAAVNGRTGSTGGRGPGDDGGGDAGLVPPGVDVFASGVAGGIPTTTDTGALVLAALLASPSYVAVNAAVPAVLSVRAQLPASADTAPVQLREPSLTVIVPLGVVPTEATVTLMVIGDPATGCAVVDVMVDDVGAFDNVAVVDDAVALAPSLASPP
jgi:hypothetical protein